MFCINTIIVSVAEVYLMNFNFTDPLCKRTRVLEYNGMLATVSLLLSVTTGVVASFTIDPDRDDEWDDQVMYRPAWLRTSCIIISFMFLGWSIFSLVKALAIEKSSPCRFSRHNSYLPLPGFMYSTSVRITSFVPFVTAEPSCSSEAVLPCGKQSTEPALGTTPRAFRPPFAAGK